MATVFLSILALAPFLSRVSAACDCYRTDAGDYFANYDFVDFRNQVPENYETVFKTLETPSYPGNNMMTPDNVILRKFCRL